MKSEMTVKLQGTVNRQSTIHMEVVRNDYKLKKAPASPMREGVYSSALPTSSVQSTVQPFNLFPCPTHHMSSHVGHTKGIILTTIL